MYTYQCSKHECGTTWTLNEGSLNGFALTCPICGKGRGLFVSQTKRSINKLNNEGIEEMVISVNSSSARTIEEVQKHLEDFKKKNSLIIISKDMESTGKEVVCKIQYKITN